MLINRELTYLANKWIEFNFADANVIDDRRLEVNTAVDVVEHRVFGDDDRW